MNFREKLNRVDPEFAVEEPFVRSAQVEPLEDNFASKLKRADLGEYQVTPNDIGDNAQPMDPESSAQLLNRRRDQGNYDNPEHKPFATNEEKETLRQMKQVAPFTYKHIGTKPEEYAALKPKIKEMMYLERLIRSVGNKQDQTNAQIDLSKLGMNQIMGTATEEDLRRAEFLESEIQRLGTIDYDVKDLIGDSFVVGLGQIPNTLEVLKGTIPGAITGGALGFLTPLPFGAPAGATVGAGIGTAYKAGTMEAGLAYREISKLKDDNGVTVDADSARGASLIVGGINGALESAGMAASFIPGLKSIKRSMLKKTLKNPGVTKILLEVGGNIFAGVAGEGITEGLQETVTILGGEFSKMAQDESFEKKTTEEILKQVFSEQNQNRIREAAIEGMKAGGSLATITSAVTTVPAGVIEIKRANDLQQALEQTDSVIEQTDEPSEVDKNQKAVVNKMVEEIGTEDLYMDVDTYKEYWQDKGFDPTEMAEELLGDDIGNYTKAEQEGGEFRIPTNKYINTYGGTPHNKFFSYEVRAESNQMNMREIMDEQQAHFEKVESDISQFDDNVVKQAKTYAEDLRQGLGPGTKNKSRAELFESALVAISKRTGMTPEQLIGSGVLVEQFESVEEADGFFALPDHMSEAEMEREGILRPGQIATPEQLGAALVTRERANNVQQRLAEAKDNLAQAQLDGYEKQLKEITDTIKNIDAIKGQLPDKEAIRQGYNESLRGGDLYIDNNGEARLSYKKKPKKETIAVSTAQGRLRIGNRSIKLDLFKNMDDSTFLHEMGHLFLYMLNKGVTQGEATGDLAETAAQDLETILNFVGASSFETMEETQHEKFADAFLIYLREGKSPSNELIPAFNSFRKWLVKIFPKLDTILRFKNIELNDDIRGVMDRMIATEQEINEAIGEMGYDQELLEDFQKWMPEKRAMEYAKTARAVIDGGANELLRSKIAKADRIKRKTFNARRKKVKQEETQKVHEDRDFTTQAILKSGKLPDGSVVPPDMTFKLDRDMVKKFFKGKLPKSLYGMTVKNGSHIDEVAYAFGYESSKEMLETLDRLRPMKDVIEQNTSERMVELYGQDEAPITTREEIMESIHTKDQATLLRMQLQALVSKEFATFKGLVKAIDRKVPVLAVEKENARKYIERLDNNEVKPINFRRAEKKARKMAMDLLLKGDIRGAFDAKRQELIQHLRYNEAVNHLKVLGQGIKYMDSFNNDSKMAMLGKASTGSFHYQDQILDIMEKYSFEKRTQATSRKMQSLRDFIERQSEAGVDITVPQNLIDEASKTHYMDLTVGDFNSLIEFVKSIEHLARTKSKLQLNKRVRDEQKLVESIIEATPDNFITPEKSAHRVATISERIFSKTNKMGSYLQKMEFIFTLLDGNEENGPLWNAAYRDAAAAATKEVDMQKASNKKLEKILSLYNAEERLANKLDTFTVEGVEGEFTKNRLLAIAFNVGNPENREALLSSEGWTPAQLDQLLDLLDARDWKYVTGIARHIESFWEQSSDVHFRVTGIRPKKVEVHDVVTKYGTFKGWYYPIKFDFVRNLTENRMDQDQINAAEEARLLFKKSAIFASTKKGHLKEREGTGGRFLKLDTSVALEHIDDVIHDITHREVVINLNKLFSNKDLSKHIVAATNENTFLRMKDWVKDIAAPKDNRPTGMLDNIISWGVSKATLVALGFKFSTGWVQFSGLLLSIKEIGFNNVMRGMWHTGALKGNMRQVKRTYDEMREKSSFMDNRWTTYERDIRALYDRWSATGKPPGIAVTMLENMGFRKGAAKLNQISESQGARLDAFFYFIGFSDMSVSMPTWWGAYHQAMGGKVKGIESNNEADAIAYADKKVRDSQGSSLTLDMSQAQRDKSIRMFTMFYHFFSVVYNQLFVKIPGQFRIDKNYFKAMYAVFLVWTLNPLIESMMLDRGPDLDDDPEEFVLWQLKQQLLFPVQSFPFIRDIATGIIGDYEYNASPFFKAVEGVTKTGKTVFDKTVTGDDFTRADYRSMWYTAGFLTGLPAGQGWITGGYIYDEVTNNYDRKNPQPKTFMDHLKRATIKSKLDGDASRKREKRKRKQRE